MADDTKNECCIALLNRCPSDLVASFIHATVDDICSQKEVCADKYSKYFNASELSNLVKEVKENIFHLIKFDELSAFAKLLDSNIQDQMQKCVTVRKEEIRRYLVQETCAISDSHLKDFDWTVKLVLASDSMTTMKEPLLKLDLELEQEKESKIVSLELTKDDLHKVVTSLEATHKALVQLKT